MTNQNPELKEALREEMRRLGRKGGKATLKKHGKGHFTKIGKKGNKAKTKQAAEVKT